MMYLFDLDLFYVCLLYNLCICDGFRGGVHVQTQERHNPTGAGAWLCAWWMAWHSHWHKALLWSQSTGDVWCWAGSVDSGNWKSWPSAIVSGASCLSSYVKLILSTLSVTHLRCHILFSVLAATVVCTKKRTSSPSQTIRPTERRWCIFLALSQTPVYTVRPRIQACSSFFPFFSLHGVPVYVPAFAGRGPTHCT